MKTAWVISNARGKTVIKKAKKYQTDRFIVMIMRPSPFPLVRVFKQTVQAGKQREVTPRQGLYHENRDEMAKRLGELIIKKSSKLREWYNEQS